MGISGLMSYFLQNTEKCIEYVDLVEIAEKQNGIEILVDFYSFEHVILRLLWKALGSVRNNPFLKICGGEYGSLDRYLFQLLSDLKSLDISLRFYVDGSRGSSKSHTSQKLATWKRRHDQDIKRLRDSLDCMDGQLDILSLPEDSVQRPVLMEIQFLATIKRVGLDVHYCSCGEADFVIHHDLLTRSKAYAILSNDTDFAIFRDCLFIPSQLFDVNDDTKLKSECILPEKPVRLSCGVITTERTMKLLECPSHDLLVEFAIVAGTDFTSPFINREVKEKIGVKVVNRTDRVDYMQSTVNWVKEHKRVENHEYIQREISRNKNFLLAINRSRKFYTGQYDSSSEDTLVKGNLSAFIDVHIRNGRLPVNLMGMHNNFYWHRFLTEDISFGHPCTEILMSDFRAYIYRMVLPRHECAVVEYGRTPWEHLQHVTAYTTEERGIPSVDRINPEKKWVNLGLMHRILIHQEPDYQRKYFSLYGWKNGFTLYCLRYFLTQNMYNNLQVSHEEFMILVAAVFGSRDNDEFCQEIPICPNRRCATIASWFQNIYRHAFAMLAAILYLVEEFPLPREIFSGAVFTAFYMASLTDLRRSSVRPISEDQISRVMHCQSMILKDKRHITKVLTEGYFTVSDRSGFPELSSSHGHDYRGGGGGSARRRNDYHHGGGYSDYHQRGRPYNTSSTRYHNRHNGNY